MSYRELLVSSSPLITYKGKVEPKVRLLGFPFDGTATYRPGSRFGPNTLREAFSNIEIYSPMLGCDAEEFGLIDLGNLRQVANVEEALKDLSKVLSELFSQGSIPCVVGGEHTLTYSAYSEAEGEGNIALLVFDAHLDLRDEYAGLRLSHTTFLRRLVEKAEARKVIHVGARAGCKEEWNYAKTVEMKMITSLDIFSDQDLVGRLKSMLKGYEGIYVSIDLDFLDPAYAPGVGNPEPGGPTTHQLLQLLQALKGFKLVGFDICELNPAYDSDGITAAVAARLLAEFICLSHL